ncbi:MAG TPA: CHASE2 domain-containing protein [Phycisphaerae bacterium]|nr:CHASE2 domain-containing protein [Phycisphaerae bacterium]
MAASGKTGRTLRGIGLGLAATLIVAAAEDTAPFRLLEHWALDLRFRRLPTVSAHPDIVHVDLDDKAMDQIGRWPWPRRRLAQLIDTLNECGARRVLLDVVLHHPQQPRFVQQGQTDLYQANADPVLNPDLPPVLVLDDVELADAMARSHELFLAMHVNVLGDDRPDAADPYEHLVESLTAMVSSRPSLTREQAAGELGLDLAIVGPAMSPATQNAYERRIAALLSAEPALSKRDLTRKMLGRDEQREEADDIIGRAYLRQRALNEMGRFALDDAGLEALNLPRGRMVPPLVTLASAARHCGFVHFIKPDDDGIVRRIPLLTRTGEGVFPQLALAVAAETLADTHGRPWRLAARPGRITLTFPDGFTRAIPADRTGRTYVNWVRLSKDETVARHISAVAAADLWDARESLRHNLNLSRHLCIESALLLDRQDVQKAFADADEAWERHQAALRARQGALLFTPGQPPPPLEDLAARERELEKAVDQACKGLIEEVDSFYLAAAAQADDPPELARLRALRALLARIEEADARLRKSLAEAKARLTERVGGKIVLVGSVSTAAADFVPTPLQERTPGVVVHANVLNTILSGRFVSRATWFSAVLVLLAGMLVTAVTSTRGPVQSSIVLAAAVLGYAGINAAVWSSTTYWIGAVAPVVAMLSSFAVVTTYRQLTEQRQKRQITSTFKQYLSPAMVDRLVSDPSQAALGGQRRELSCLFSDLAGFTSLSERLGPERTVSLLNRYLDRVGEIIQLTHGGTLSKYEGDGVFAFFGAPIAQPDHSARALHAAIACQTFLPAFTAELHAEGLLPADVELGARAGITTGDVLVGNMGSTQRVAYTAIGDSVNLAARLETANKFFGSRILVNDQAWQAGGEGLIGRPMGRILVVGKSQPVSVWEPLGIDGEGADGLVELAQRFTDGVALYARGQFQAGYDLFAALLADRPDGPARAYLDLCAQALADPPEVLDFDGVIRLTEK